MVHKIIILKMIIIYIRSTHFTEITHNWQMQPMKNDEKFLYYGVR